MAEQLRRFGSFVVEAADPAVAAEVRKRLNQSLNGREVQRFCHGRDFSRLARRVRTDPAELRAAAEDDMTLWAFAQLTDDEMKVVKSIAVRWR
jgi:hypothetical protein